ncbi:hypothetical protein N7474_007167 [Penicillium riverlandense]|uniref:uncharacterized protein n=1 Tax=Penicillium riverlandense TaxID=1903569 RepID=UPI0025490A9B|nr:uncharacterized protein N7474_007167 [Penicillium riverlandense]KAJ5815390.1 hypothetical protein N7474_007167 [Penicillium riverlandense]
MADASLAWEERPSDLAGLSSDEEDFVSSQSTASVEPDALAKKHLSTALGRLQLTQSTSDLYNGTRIFTPGTTETDSGQTSHVRKPLHLLELPLDVLKDIIKEVTHTSDLTSLALTCSVLHSLTIPQMYSRFDIIWPESLNSATDDCSGVDALSYGLSTLVMGEDVFHQLPLPRSNRSTDACSHCGCDDRGHHPSANLQENGTTFRSRRGNYYAQYTRTFSIGNGPLHWVQEYSVTKEIGKMLGTLVALAVARMVNLEAFIWDMPTGVVREIWLALASLADRPGHNCRLERVWVRWHDNSENSVRNSSTASARLSQKYKHVEHPSLSVLPPLKSIAVLDIDEPAYVEELAVLIERSRHRLTELRIGIAAKAYLSEWLLCEKDFNLPVDPSAGWPRPGGILEILSRRGPLEDERTAQQQDDTATVTSTMAMAVPSEDSVDTDKASKSGNSSVPAGEASSQTAELPNGKSTQSVSSGSPLSKVSSPIAAFQPDRELLKLELLELERVPLSVSTILPAIDWTRLTTLSIMRCQDHEKLWRALRRKYAPPVVPGRRAQDGEHRRLSTSSLDYCLQIKHLRTDTVSPYLMLFIKDALAPNTLESVFLHEAPLYDSAVQVEAIYRHILRKHRLSLRKVLVDATERLVGGTDMHSARWHKWMFNHEVVSFVTSGRMPQLKELGMAMHYRDWILDIVSIRPELKISYVGLQSKCYQILEAGPGEADQDVDETHSGENTGDGLSNFDGDGDADHIGPSDDDEDSIPGFPSSDTDLIPSDNNSWSDDGSEPDDEHASRVRFRLQEILFYDDKISIFKARHGVL